MGDQQVVQEISWLGSRLREPSTYAGLGILLGLVFRMQNADHLAANLQTVGIGIGMLITGLVAIFVPEGNNAKTIVKAAPLVLFFAIAWLSFGPLPANAQTAPAATPAPLPPIITASPMVTKAPVYNASGLNAIFNGYPYGSSGFFFGIYSEGGGGSVNGSVAGVGSASLTDTQAGVGGTVGWAWGQKNSPVAFSVEGDFGWTNFNGNSAGFSLDGPLHFEQRFVAFTPLSTMLSLLPNLPSLGSLPPFAALPAGVTASNIQLGIMAGVDEDDISPNFPGLAANMQWRAAPMIGLVQMEQLSNSVAMRTWIKAEFPDKSVCIGPVANACAGLSTQYKLGLGIYY